jgi:hypothetical protein
VCVYAHSRSKTPRSQSAPSRLGNPDTHKHRTWYEKARTEEKADAVNLDGEPQPPASSCASGVYKKLDESKRQIRLLELHPGSREDPIGGNLITVDLPVPPPYFDESVLVDQLSRISKDIVFAVRSGSRVQEDDVHRWESTHDSLIWLLASRLSMTFIILKKAPTCVNLLGLLRRVSSSSNLSKPASKLQEISDSLATTLSRCSAYHSWTHDLNGLTNRLSAQRTRTRHSMIHFAEQMNVAVIKFLSEDRDGVSALTSVDVPGLERFLSQDCQVKLTTWPSFAAVSWFWGDAEHRDKMELDGNPVDIPFNAIRALRDLRDSVHSRKLWIDAVCINQDDKAERASQIMLMSDIYSIAGSTYVWLGNEELVIKQAIYILKLLKRLPPYIKDVDAADVSGKGPKIGKDCAVYVPADHESSSDVSSSTFNSIDMHLCRESASSTKSASEIPHRVSLGHRLTWAQSQSALTPELHHFTNPLFDLPWFSRLWVLQEAGLSSHCTIVFGSDITLPWQDLEHGALLIHDFSMRGRPPSKGLYLALAVSFQRNNRRNGSRLLELVSQGVSQECSDPRDYIFGLLGLTVWAKQRLRWPRLVQPSYVKSIPDCMRDATRVMIQEECNLSALLHWCQAGQSPTWAVHWHRHKQLVRLSIWCQTSKASELHSPDPRPLDLILMEESPDLNILLLKGHSVASVHSMTALLGVDGDKAVESGLAAFKLALRHIMDLSARTGFEFSPHTITLTLIACTPRYKALTPKAEEFGKIEHVVSSLWDELHGQRSKRCLDLPISEICFFARFCEFYNHCRLFTTQAGQLCVGPEGVAEGDKVVRLFGLPLPALLRPEQSWFTWAGAAYIDREFPDVQDMSTRTPEIFEIR